jgi:hypothetical protein
VASRDGAETGFRFSWRRYGWMIAVPLLAYVASIAAYVSQFGRTSSEDQAVWGQFGDFVGGLLNPMISAIALVAVIVSLRANAHALELSAKAIEHAEAATAKQIEVANTERTAALISFMLSPDMLKARSACDEWFRRQEDAEIAQMVSRELRREGERQGDYDAVWKVLEFFEQVAVLRRLGRLDDSVAAPTIGMRYRYFYREHLQRLYKIGDGVGDEHWLEFIATVRQLDDWAGGHAEPGAAPSFGPSHLQGTIRDVSQEPPEE